VPEHLADDYVFTAGQHLSIRGPDEKRRSFSIFTAPSTGLLRVGVKKLPGGSFSEGVLGGLRIGRLGSRSQPVNLVLAEPDIDLDVLGKGQIGGSATGQGQATGFG
jgi:ferredoxin-NADP reductase